MSEPGRARVTLAAEVKALFDERAQHVAAIESIDTEMAEVRRMLGVTVMVARGKPADESEPPRQRRPPVVARPGSSAIDRRVEQLRSKILAALQGGPAFQYELAERCGASSQTISRYLAVMERTGLVEPCADGWRLTAPNSRAGRQDPPPADTESDIKADTQSLEERRGSILRALQDGPKLPYQIDDTCGITRTIAHNDLRRLRYEGKVEQSDEGWRLASTVSHPDPVVPSLSSPNVQPSIPKHTPRNIHVPGTVALSMNRYLTGAES